MHSINNRSLLFPSAHVQPVKPKYANFAERAVSYEKEQNWLMAIPLWNMASVLAQHKDNCRWARSRAEFCKHRMYK